ncbi:MAG: DegQ family serine endoprotease [Desulfobacterales bacterium]|nr:DegQ family serine endoprotease [Desulfobacterales bacterium]MDD4392790.1 DegQ family serine endoprotease [Desulfobacterales bacterium]
MLIIMETGESWNSRTISPGKRYVKFLSIICLVIQTWVWMLVLPASSQAFTTADARSGIPQTFSPLVKTASPSVVNISIVKTIKGTRMPSLPFAPDDPMRDFFEQFFGEQIPEDFKQQSLGTGFIIDQEGFILTNNHVVEKADEIKVILADSREFIARVIGRDPKTDLALIRIEDDKPLPALPLGDSDKLEVGDWVVAIGNPFGLGNTVTSGIVSAKYRHLGVQSYDNFIQTDASINPGNSGGPLLNISGEVIGINSVIFSQSGGNIGIGFAIPINMAKALIPQLKKGKVIRGWLGVIIQQITPALKDKLGLKNELGALVSDVPAGGPADKSGIQRGDVISSFNGKSVTSSRDLPAIVAATPVGKTVEVEIIRKGQLKTIQVTIEEMNEQGEEGPAPAVREKSAGLGMRVEALTPEISSDFGLTQTTGIIVVEVQPDSPTENAGIMAGDIVLEVDQVPVKNIDDFYQKIKPHTAGDTILFLIERQGITQYVALGIPK